MLDKLEKNVRYTLEKCWIYLREMMQNNVIFSKMLHGQKKMLPSELFCTIGKKKLYHFFVTNTKMLETNVTYDENFCYTRTVFVPRSDARDSLT